MCRFSNQASGSLSSWPNSVSSSRRFMWVERKTPSQARTAVVATCISTSSEKASPSSVSRSRSRPTITRSITSCTKNGAVTANTSSASDSSSTWAIGPPMPPAAASSCQAVMRSRSSCRAKPSAGVSSIATPV